MFPFLHVCTDNIQHNTIKLHFQAYYPVCYPPQFHYPVHMLLFQYDSYTILFVSTLYPPPMHLALSPFQRVSCTHSMSNPLRSTRSATSLPLPVMVPTFNVDFIFLAFFLSSFIFFLFLHCFPPLLYIQLVCPPVTLGAQSLVTVVVFLGLDRSGMKSDFTTRIEKYLAMFYAGCPSCRNLPI